VGLENPLQIHILSLKQNHKRTKIFYAFLTFLHTVQNLSYVHQRDLDKRIKKGVLLLLGA
jgi:hypothetical protein